MKTLYLCEKDYYESRFILANRRMMIINPKAYEPLGIKSNQGGFVHKDDYTSFKTNPEEFVVYDIKHNLEFVNVYNSKPIFTVNSFEKEEK